MKTILTVVCMLLAMCVARAAGAPSAQKPTTKRATLSSSELRAFAKADPDAKSASAIYSVAMATNNVDQQQKYLKCAAACLIACDKRDVYAKNVKGKLQNAEGFEQGLKDSCGKCSGAGKKDRSCDTCNGNGRCSSCKGSGQTVSMGFNRPNEWKTCGKCRGDKKCGKCGGRGSINEKCMTCAGTGRLFNKAIAERVFRESCKELADAIDPVILARKEKERKEAEERAKAEVARKEKERKEAEARAKDMPQKQEASAKNGGDEVRKAKEEFTKCCIAVPSENAVGIEYQGISYQITGENFAIYEQESFSIGRQTVWGAVNIVVLRSRTDWYNAVKECTDKLKEWIRIAEKNKVKHVSKEMHTSYMNVRGYPSKITEGRGQAELLLNAVRRSYSSFVSEQIKFVGSVEANDEFKRFDVKLNMVCGEYFKSTIFGEYGSIEQIEKELVKFLVFVDPASLEKALDEQAEKESLFH